MNNKSQHSDNNSPVDNNVLRNDSPIRNNNTPIVETNSNFNHFTR